MQSKSAFVRLLIIYVLWTVGCVFGGSLIYLYFENAGVGEFDLAASYLFSFLSTIFVIYLLNRRKRLDFRRLMFLAMLLIAFAYFLLYLLPPTKELLFVYSFLFGLTFFLFWVPFNILYFELSTESAPFLVLYISL